MSNYYEILPLKKTGPESRTFTYHSDTSLTLGSLVQIPLKNRSVRGVVLSHTNKPVYETREIEKVLSEEPILSKKQIAIAQKISEYYFCSLGETINAFLPFDFGKKRRQTKEPEIRGEGLEVKKIEPNEEQRKIVASIKKSPSGSIHLIHGVTGSGKTEVYLQLAAQALKEGSGSIILVPEIALTPQTEARFRERFGDEVAVWHSNLKETDKYHTWNQVKQGAKKIILGARSAIFMPVKDLAYIFIDEEHENSYKQDSNPRYDARLVAEWLAVETGAKLILGSATPRIESYYRSLNNEPKLYSMNKRIVQDNMPPVKIVDLRNEFRKGNKSIISDNLLESMTETLKRGKQVMILVNRRGAATFVSCRDCGYTEMCPNCDLPLTYHPSEGQVLKCHHCDYRRTTPVICPSCQSAAIKYFGLGTQRTELELQKIFPKARIVRMDHDTTQRRGAHEDIYNDFKDEKFDILIGTQMIAKGWDLPNVELVGVISADTMLNLPDFRSAERTFSLLTQVAGRTGRGYHPGQVIIQTYNPDNLAILAASKHSYLDLYETEITSRKRYLYPPFSSLIRLIYAHPDSHKAETEAARMAAELEKAKGIIILGPSPAFLERLAGKYRYQIVIKIPTTNKPVAPLSETPNSPENNRRENLKLKTLEILKKNFKPGWTIDIDPESLL